MRIVAILLATTWVVLSAGYVSRGDSVEALLCLVLSTLWVMASMDWRERS